MPSYFNYKDKNIILFDYSRNLAHLAELHEILGGERNPYQLYGAAFLHSTHIKLLLREKIFDVLL